MMDNELFNELVDSIKEAGKIKRGKQRYVGLSTPTISAIREKANYDALTTVPDNKENRINEVIHAK